MPRVGRRLLEWGLTLLVILLGMGYFFYEFQYVEGQAELAAVKTTLGSLRTALLLDYLKAVTDGNTNQKPLQSNPFLLLDHPQANYAGELAQAKAKSQTLPAGAWVFDSYCRCIGYLPLHGGTITAVTDAPSLWFRISAPPGPLQITTMKTYLWQGQPLE